MVRIIISKLLLASGYSVGTKRVMVDWMSNTIVINNKNKVARFFDFPKKECKYFLKIFIDHTCFSAYKVYR